MKYEIIYVRVLEQDTCDQIRIGMAYPIYKDNLDNEVSKIKEAYNKQFAWCGGWNDENNNKYHQRIAIVDAETLQSVKEIWNKKRQEQPKQPEKDNESYQM